MREKILRGVLAFVITVVLFASIILLINSPNEVMMGFIGLSLFGLAFIGIYRILLGG